MLRVSILDSSCHQVLTPLAGALDGGRKPKRVQRYDEPGEKTRYFADDDGQDLESLVKRQRYEGAEDIDANLAENIARKATYKWGVSADGISAFSTSTLAKPSRQCWSLVLFRRCSSFSALSPQEFPGKEHLFVQA